MDGTQLRRLLDDHQFFHDTTQLERFIVAGAGWTPWSAYKQCLRELRTRLEGLKTDYRLLKGIDIDKREMEHKLRGQMNAFERERANLAYELKVLEQETADATKRDREREFVFFAAQAHAIRESMGELGDITPERRAELDAESWAVRLRAQAAAELCANGRVELNTMSAIRLLPPQPRAMLITELREPELANALIGWWQTFEPDLPKPGHAIPIDDVEVLITCQLESLQLS